MMENWDEIYRKQWSFWHVQRNCAEYGSGAGPDGSPVFFRRVLVEVEGTRYMCVSLTVSTPSDRMLEYNSSFEIFGIVSEIPKLKAVSKAEPVVEKKQPEYEVVDASEVELLAVQTDKPVVATTARTELCEDTPVKNPKKNQYSRATRFIAKQFYGG